MYALRSAASRRARSLICTQCLRPTTTPSTRAFSLLTRPRATTPRRQYTSITNTFPCTLSTRTYSSKTSADSLIEEIQDQYATARDEFEIAAEETEKKSVYAADDRAAAREELNKLKVVYEEALGGPDGEEIKGRVGQRIRELDNAIEAMEKSVIED